MPLIVDIAVFGREDRAAWFPTPSGGVLVVADGAGGTGGGAQAAAAVITAVAAAGEPGDAAACVALLAGVDVNLRVGETTAVVVVVARDDVYGASVGDSGVWWICAGRWIDLGEHQRRKPLIGSGSARPVPFTARLGEGTLLLASDGLFNYTSPQRITDMVTGDSPGGLAVRLCELVRLPSGAFNDDVAVIVARGAGPAGPGGHAGGCVVGAAGSAPGLCDE